MRDVPGLGSEGSLKTVPVGYWRNYLQPQGLAAFADAGILERIRQQREAEERTRLEEKAKAQAMVSRGREGRPQAERRGSASRRLLRASACRDDGGDAGRGKGRLCPLWAGATECDGRSSCWAGAAGVCVQARMSSCRAVQSAAGQRCELRHRQPRPTLSSPRRPPRWPPSASLW